MQPRLAWPVDMSPERPLSVVVEREHTEQREKDFPVALPTPKRVGVI
jgi:hypothetical protein